MACVDGSVDLRLEPYPGGQIDRLLYRASGALTVTFDPVFAGEYFGITSSEVCKSPGCFGGGTLVGPSLLRPVVGAWTLPIEAFPGDAFPADLPAFRGLDGALYFEYGLPNDDPATTYSGRLDLTFTATPEPATLALTAAGLLAAAGAGWRRRRPA